MVPCYGCTVLLHLLGLSLLASCASAIREWPFWVFLSSEQFIREQKSSFPSEENCGNIEKDIKLLLKGEHIEKQ